MKKHPITTSKLSEPSYFLNFLLFKGTSPQFNFNFLCCTLICILPFFTSCKHNSKPEQYNALAGNALLFHNCSEQLTNVIVFDIFKPPVASRIYTYSYLAAYETMRQQYPSYKSMAGIINQFKIVPKPKKGVEYCFPLAGMAAFNRVGEQLTFSADLWDTFNKKFYPQFEKMGIPDDVYKRSVEYGEEVARHVLKYADSDNYKQTRGVKFPVINLPGRWVPTPPAYADACEPVWTKTRHFLIDSSSQFKPATCAMYDMNPNSKYFHLLKQVYDISKNLTQDQKNIAAFWEDNGFVTHTYGHAMFATKKMTPPGHWLAIVRTVAKLKKLDMMRSAQAYVITSLAMHDAFIMSWDEKYKSNRVRPITVIEQYFDPNWMSFLQTPSFPEYVSGHSAISAAAGTVLTRIVGDNIAFTDSTENAYGFGVRSFTSFKQAYHETNDSRVYGGIHYRDGADEAMKQGEKVGNLVLKKLGADNDQYATANTKR